MKFEDHSELRGQHALLSPSNYHWINYSPEKMEEVYTNLQAAQRGTLIHDFASRCIGLHQRLPKKNETLNLFVNDSIDYKMESEKVLYYSPNCFGTADAIRYYKKKLLIFDLKTGLSPASIHQLEIYAALFCLERKLRPESMEIELRIYQNNEVLVDNPDPVVISDIMDTITSFDRLIEKLKSEE